MNVSCESNNLVYAIECNTCGKHYVGQTRKCLRERFVHHFWTVTGEALHLTIGKHFSEKNGHHLLDDITIYILEFCKGAPDAELLAAREAVEDKWIYRLNSKYPHGLNQEDGSG